MPQIEFDPSGEDVVLLALTVMAFFMWIWVWL